MNCPTCGSQMFRVKEKKNPKGPDWFCSDKECKNEKGYRTGAWDKKEDGNIAGAAARAVAKTTPAKVFPLPTPKHTWTSLQDTYQNSVKLASAVLKKWVPNLTPEAIVAGAATVFIEANRSGVLPQQPLDEKPKQLVPDDGDDDALPF